ncbi:hypothetical protein V7S43_004946 [Phytophthora oleae]|uniref:Uncharacterized protein n=1 Tax=Phytophthora oleae TaxID=2107226 RepID=A0ABD3FX68_9STRA
MGIAVGAVYLLRTELNLLFAKEPLIDEKEQMMIALVLHLRSSKAPNLSTTTGQYQTDSNRL